jgi:acetyl-CoA C-acetyltransferase
MKQDDPIVIAGGKRTPMGGFQGELAPLSATALGAHAIHAALSDASIDGDQVDEVIMGCVLPAGLGQAPARQASLGAGIPLSTGCTTVNKMCGSGMKAAMLAHDLITAGSGRVMVAGGMESMTNAPYLLPRVREGLRMGHGQVMDHMFLDGLEDAYEPGRLMGTYAEDCAERFQFTRESQDAFAIESLARAKRAGEDGTFAAEVAGIEVKTRRGSARVDSDEQPRTADVSKIPTLRPAFRKDGTVTAANSSSISDGAAALVMMRRSEAQRRDLPVRAEIHGHATYASEPGLFTTAPISAIRGLFQRNGWSLSDVDLFEVNEAFAVVTLATMRELDIAHDRMNVHGGACALGHPVGASGARIMLTLLNALEKYGLTRGVAALCIGGGEATAIGLQRPQH